MSAKQKPTKPLPRLERQQYTMQILEDGHWLDVSTRARTPEAMRRIYKQMCRKNPSGPPYGFRIIEVKEERLGRFPTRKGVRK